MARYWYRARAVILSPVGSSFASSPCVPTAAVNGVLLARARTDGRGTLAAVIVLPGIVTGLGSLGLNKRHRLGNRQECLDRDQPERDLVRSHP